MNNNPIAKFWIDGVAVGKSRPRPKRIRSRETGKMITIFYYSDSYTSWMNQATRTIQVQMKEMPLAPTPARLVCKFVNFRSSDADNLTGSVADALVAAGYLSNDSSSFMSSAEGHFVSCRKKKGQPQLKGVLVEIYQGEYEQIDGNEILNLIGTDVFAIFKIG